MKILIVVPSFKVLGGVSSHYVGLAPYWRNKVCYFHYGKRPHIPAIVTFIPDLIGFVFRMCFGRYDVLIVNPSLTRYQLFRDSLYLRIGLLFHKKVVTFIYGWEYPVAEEIVRRPSKFCNTYGKSRFIYVLYSGFKKTLESLPMQAPVLLATTKVSDKLLDGFDMAVRNGKIERLLFLARLDRAKGLDVTIQAFEILKKQYPYLKLDVCGSGDFEDEMKQYVSQHKIEDVFFHGRAKGRDIVKAFTCSDLYILPTTHGEGMATSVLEAMAFGLPVVSRPVGGVCDFFEEGKMGYLLESLEAKDYADKVDYLIQHPETVRQMSITNHSYAKEHFLASEVTKKFEKDLAAYCSTQK